MTYAVTDFESEVLDRSSKKPVLVDFWAPWCGPCRKLGPVLEQMAEEQDTWVLAKLNVDEFPELAQQHNVRGIPAVKLFVDGEVTDEFTGALPRHSIQKWLDEAIPTKSKSHLEEARQALQERDPQGARDHLYEVLAEEPEHDEAQLLLAQTLIFDDPKKAQAFASGADVAKPVLMQKKESVLTLAQLLLEEEELPDGEGRVEYKKGLEALRNENFDSAIDHFIKVIQQDRYYANDGARRICVALFTVLGNNHPAVSSHRRTFDMALY